MNFGSNVPDAAKQALNQLALQFPSAESLLGALASDERMELVWSSVRSWTNDQIKFLVESVALYANPDVLTDLTLPPEKRAVMPGSSYQLSFAARDFADAIKKNRLLAAEFWPEPIEPLLKKLGEFSQQLFDRGLAIWSSMESIPSPSRRGRGEPREIAFGNAITRCLENIGGLTREKQDSVIAVLTDVVFGRSPDEETDPEVIRARRKRQRRQSSSPQR